MTVERADCSAYNDVGTLIRLDNRVLPFFTQTPLFDGVALFFLLFCGTRYAKVEIEIAVEDRERGTS